MKSNKSDIFSGQRYYHVIAFQAAGNLYSLPSFWRDCNVLKSNIKSTSIGNFVIEQGKLISEEEYHFGDEDFSVNGDGKPPFQYDIFAIGLQKQDILIFGFPLRRLAKGIIDKMIDQRQILKKGYFIKPDLSKLIKEEDRNSQFSLDSFTTYFSSVELTLTGETNISSVNLDGDRPLESNLYKRVFLDKILKGQCNLDKCSLKCEISENESELIYKTKSNIHLDLFGNYKLYIHGTGKNLITIPFLFEILSKLKCLKKSLINPLIKNINEQLQ